MSVQNLQSCLKLRNSQNPFCYILEKLNKNFEKKIGMICSFSSDLYCLKVYNSHSKGQLISKCLFEKIVWTKIPLKNLIDSALCTELVLNVEIEY